MPLTHTSAFRVRYYECDPYGHVNNANYLRYMQEAAFDASAAGYGPARYEAMNRLWLVRESEVEYLRPLRHGQTVEVKTWVQDFRRVRSRRVYELRAGGSQELAARGLTDWVFLERETLRPARVPRELIAAFFPEGPPPEAPRRQPFPEPPPPPPGVFTYRRRVAWSDIDPTGHVHNATYLTYIEDCGVAVSEAFGWPMGRYLQDGAGWLARKHRLEYLQEAVLGDELAVAAWLSDMRRASCTRHYLIRRASDEKVLARARTDWAFVRLADGRPARIPRRLLQDFAGNVSAG